MIKKIFPLILLQMLSTNSFADNKVEVITICEVQKVAYVHIEPYNSQYKGVFKSVPTSFSFEEKQNGKTYSLVVETKDNKEHLYYFNLDHKGNGFMSMVNTRWNSFADLVNNQSLFFCVCKKPTN